MHVGGTEMKLEAVVDTATGEKVHCAVIDNNNKRSAFVLTLEHFINAINSGITNTDADITSMPKHMLQAGPISHIMKFQDFLVLLFLTHRQNAGLCHLTNRHISFHFRS